MKKHFTTAILYTAITGLMLGIVYPLGMTLIAHLLFPHAANGSLISHNGTVIGSQLIGQSFTGPGYFHSRPSEAGSGYDAANSSGSNLGPTSKALADRVNTSVAAEKNASGPVPIDLVTASASGLDPDITPAAALYQAQRIGGARHLPLTTVLSLIKAHTASRQFGLLGEPRVNVLALNVALDAAAGR
jgi:K+-transporting ATPase ATPase C chain